MKEKLEKRLNELRMEFESGQKMLADLEAKEMTLRNTLIRISSAIQVLEEELKKAETAEQAPVAQQGGGEKVKGNK
jgi:septal ring factor EnvC (AmiA/AmiB activator)